MELSKEEMKKVIVWLEDYHQSDLWAELELNYTKGLPDVITILENFLDPDSTYSPYAPEDSNGKK